MISPRWTFAPSFPPHSPRTHPLAFSSSRSLIFLQFFRSSPYTLSRLNGYTTLETEPIKRRWQPSSSWAATCNQQVFCRRQRSLRSKSAAFDLCVPLLFSFSITIPAPYFRASRLSLHVLFPLLRYLAARFSGAGFSSPALTQFNPNTKSRTNSSFDRTVVEELSELVRRISIQISEGFVAETMSYPSLYRFPK